ncbi:MAG: lectin like domain-containing protein [Elusimicrobiales bacterium]
MRIAAFLLFLPACAAAQDKPQYPPGMNGEFIARVRGVSGAAKPGGAGRFGAIPSPINAFYSRYPAGGGPKPLSGAAPPSSYDLRTYGKVTAVRDQGNCGSCWAFATMGSLESYLLTGETWDFSENNLKNTHGFDVGACDGGNIDMSSAYLLRWSGPVLESQDPYVDSPNHSPTGLAPSKHAQNHIYIPPRTGPADNNGIKNAVVNYGAVAVMMKWSGGAYNSATSSYYYSSGGYDGLHEVAIIGWDDNYPLSNFIVHPAGNGAFLVKNSWGTGWGNAGYFYVSYYDAAFAARIADDTAYFGAVFGANNTSNYDRSYQYDPLGWAYSYPSATGTWFANMFTSTASSEAITGAGFYTYSPATSYEMKVYTGGAAASPAGGTLAFSTAGVLAEAGFHTLPVTGVNVAYKDRFSVVVRIVSPPDTDFVIPVELAIDGYSSASAPQSGRGYVSVDGTAWTDAASLVYPSNICLKAYGKGGVTMSGDNLLAALKVYPNPSKPGSDGGVKFANLPGFAAPEIRIYTVSGKLARKLTVGDGIMDNPSGMTTGLWDGRNSSGEHMASGVYIYSVKARDCTRTGKAGILW